MGLDNGVTIRYSLENIPTNNASELGRNYVSIPSQMRERSHWMAVTEEDSKLVLESEVVYWRKCWGIRNEMVAHLNNKYKTDDRDEYKWSLDTEDCYCLIEILREYDNKDVWDNEGRSIWDYEDDHMHDHLLADIHTLHEIIRLLQDNNPRVLEVYFYDSY